MGNLQHGPSKAVVNTRPNNSQPKEKLVDVQNLPTIQVGKILKLLTPNFFI
jgi:hypothetical protein